MDRFKNKTTGIITSLDYRKKRVKFTYWICIAFLLLLSLITFLPPLWVLLSSMKDMKEFFAIPPTLIPKTFHPEKLVETWKRTEFARFYINSLIVVGGCCAFSIVFNGLFAYVISKVRPKGYKITHTLVLWSLMIPGTMGLIPLFINIVNLGLIDSYVSLWAISGASAFNIILYKNFFDSLPDELLEAAKIDGASEITIFSKIVFPLSKAINMVVLIFTINIAWSDFLVPFLVLKNPDLHTVMVKIYSMSTSTGLPADQHVVALTFAIVPPVIIYIFLQKQIMEGFVTSGIKG